MQKRLINQIHVLFLILVLSGDLCWAVSDDYQNNLSGVDVKKTGDKNIGVTLYTDSNYKEPINVVKKSDTQYVLLLPETSNSAAGKITSDINKTTGGLVKDVDVKHYSYPTGSLNNGYTKVTITTNEPVNISADTSSQNIGAKKSSTMPPLKTTGAEAGSKPQLRTERAKVTSNIETSENANTVRSSTTSRKVQKSESKRIATNKTQKNKSTNSKVTSKKVASQPPVIKKAPEPVVEVQEEKPIQLEVKSDEFIENEQTVQDIPSEEITIETPVDTAIEYEDAVENSLKDKWRENENAILVILAFLLIPLLLLSNKIKQFPKNVRRNNKKRGTVASKLKNHVRPTQYQQELINIMDNSNLSWQERYSLLKKQEMKNGNTQIIPKKQETRNEDTLIVPKKQEEKVVVETEQVTQEPIIPKLVIPSFHFFENKVASKQEESTPAKKNRIQGHLNIAKFVTAMSDKESGQSIPELVAQVQIAPNKGFYLTKFEEQTFLIGYVGEEVFVIRKFGKMQVSSLQARLNEKKKSGDRYLVKAGTYKALVEVADKMKLVLEL